MTNVTSISAVRTRRATNRNIAELKEEAAAFQPEGINSPQDGKLNRILEDLDALADEMLIRKLALIHDREAAIRRWSAEEESIVAEMEAAAYLAFCSGVPEEAIYDLDHEPLSTALQNAIQKVQATA